MRLIIYTAIFNNFDILRPPKIINKNVKYICFSNTKINCPPWKIKIVKPEYKDLRLENRKYKILSHKSLKDYNYDISVYLDGNYRILCDLSKFVEKWLRNNEIAVHRNPYRNCIYKEAEICIKGKIDNKELILKQISKYKSEGYPKNNGLSDNSFIIRKNSEGIIHFNEVWWNEVKNYSVRDQISFNYVINKLKMEYSIIPNPSPRLYRNKYLKVIRHGSKLDRNFLIQEIIDHVKAKIYLEVYLSKFNDFLKLECTKKIGVLNNPILNNPIKKIWNLNMGEIFHNLKSIIYYYYRNKINIYNKYIIARNNNLPQNVKNLLIEFGLDVVFIDRMNNYKQVLAVVLNSLKYLKKRGIIIVNGSNPPAETIYFSKTKNDIKNKKGKKIDQKHYNDVWKAIAYLRIHRSDLNIFVLDFENGFGIISKSQHKVKLDHPPENLKTLSYKDLERNREKILNLNNFQYFRKFINEF